MIASRRKGQPRPQQALQLARHLVFRSTAALAAAAAALLQRALALQDGAHAPQRRCIPTVLLVQMKQAEVHL